MHSLERHAGTVSVIVALVGILAASWLDPTFSWTGDALSHLGVRARSAPIFNGTLVVAGGLGAVFGAGIARSARSVPERVVGIIFVVSAVCLIGVGLFVDGHPLHIPSAIGFYLLATVAFLIDGFSRRTKPRGQVTLLFAGIHLLAWIAWGAGWWPGHGLALPESAGAILVGLWIWVAGPQPSVLAGHDRRG